MNGNLNGLNGVRVTRVNRSIFIPLPQPLWRSCGPCHCAYCKGGEGWWDTLAVSTNPADHHTWTIHAPELQLSCEATPPPPKPVVAQRETRTALRYQLMKNREKAHVEAVNAEVASTWTEYGLPMHVHTARLRTNKREHYDARLSEQLTEAQRSAMTPAKAAKLRRRGMDACLAQHGGCRLCVLALFPPQTFAEAAALQCYAPLAEYEGQVWMPMPEKYAWRKYVPTFAEAVRRDN